MVLLLQVISLGAGKDSLFFRLRDRGIAPAGGYLEVDFPAVSTWKARVVARSPALSALASGEKPAWLSSRSSCVPYVTTTGITAPLGWGKGKG